MKPHRSDWHKTILAWAVIAEAVALVIVVAAYPWPRATPSAPQGAPITFGPPSISGNPTSGWTFLVRTYVVVAWERPGPIHWGSISIRLEGWTNGGPLNRYPLPAGTTLDVFPSSGWVPPPYGPRVAGYNLFAGTWVSGALAPVDDGHWILLSGMIPPGEYTTRNGTGMFSGPSLVFTYPNDGPTGQNVTFFLPLGR